MGLGCDCPGSPQVGTAESCVPYAAVQSFSHRTAGLVTAHRCLPSFVFNFHTRPKDHSPRGCSADGLCVGDFSVGLGSPSRGRGLVTCSASFAVCQTDLSSQPGREPHPWL